MREILFRGKREDNGEWVIGYFIRQGVVAYISVPVYDRPNEVYQVNPETVGQFIGRLDKHGKKVFEGDLVNFHYFYDALGEGLRFYEAEKEIKGMIVFQEMGLWIECETEEDSGYLLWINGIHEESYEITGNIYEKEANNG